MRYSRMGIVAVLVAAEVFIGGAILWALGGRGFAIQAATLPAAGRNLPVIDAGSAPHVVVDDPDSGLVVTASTDGKVHVTDRSHVAGWTWGTPGRRPALQVARTADGVSIVRAGDTMHFALFGIDFERIEVAVPPNALLDVRRCSGADVSGLTGEVRIHSVDGHITARDIRTASLTMSSQDGSLRLDNVNAQRIDAATDDGSIRGNLTAGTGALRTSDGSVRLQLTAANLSVHAQTADGRVVFNNQVSDSSDDASSGDFQIGSGGSRLDVSSQDGSIHITTNGVQ